MTAPREQREAWLRKGGERLQNGNPNAAGPRPSGGIRLSLINNLMIVIAAIVSTVMLFTSGQVFTSYRGMQTLTERCITCQRDAELFQEASDYLTAECRYFAITGDPVHARNFAEEVGVTRRREEAINGVADLLREAESYGHLARGLELSDALARREAYAMRLTAAAFDCPEDALPALVTDVALSGEDAAMAPDAQREAAVEMLFGEEYQASKAAIYECVENSITALIESTQQAQLDASAHLNRLLLRQRALIAALLVLVFAMVLITYLLVIRPLQRCVEPIRSHREIPVTGSAEMQFLARTYNDISAQNQRSTEKLTYSATHDSLTGVFNRTAYDDEILHLDDTPVAVLSIDVDKFKTYNDNYGHDVGDRVLQKVARVITESFRSNDFISRIGGDEFCVIMKNADSHLRALVKGKIDRANQRLRNPDDGLPRVSLSVGVAFSDRENPNGDIFKDADTVLYQVKRSGGGDCAFY